MAQLSFHTPHGALTISERDGRLVSVDWGWGRDQTETPLLLEARAQFECYFDGTLRNFTLPIVLLGSPYQQRIWSELAGIPYGETRTYAEIAAAAGGAARSVGQANRRNPLPILIPCHRVVGSSGIGGYTGGNGDETKRQLLLLEKTAVSVA
ncbi:MAG: methylated-DNA--[protein]-cysteine S-methyltransferase [Gemmatimonadaceae bacterium]|nr:methylated-DNA--[protein]-cysteine S-methyltransferase [Acetobacteraceae bacterium]